MSCIKRIALLIKIKDHTIMHLYMSTTIRAIENITIIKAITETSSINIGLIKYISRDQMPDFIDSKVKIYHKIRLK
jgi:hypothetical protein